MLATAAKQWWVLVLQGILGIAFGILAIAYPNITLVTLAYLFAAWAIIAGVAEIAEGWRVAEFRGKSWPFAVSGVASIVAGLIAAFLPGLTIAGLLLFLGIWLVIAGVMEIYAAWKIREAVSNEWILALAGIARAVLGIAILAYPNVGGAVVVAWVAVAAIISGIISLVIGWRLRGLSQTIAGSAPAQGAA
jgi:uncharacterized membrane protein HdeD (DUF308 family)